MTGKPPLALLVGGGAAVAALLAVLVVAFVSMRKRAGNELCLLNLRQIGMAMKRGELPSAPEWDAAGTGRAFLASYPQWPTRIPIPPLDLSCPVRGEPGDIDYRGPARPLRLMKNEEPVCADRPGNHGPARGGNVMLRTGEVYACREQDALWAQAARTTSD